VNLFFLPFVLQETVCGVINNFEGEVLNEWQKINSFRQSEWINKSTKYFWHSVEKMRIENYSFSKPIFNYLCPVDNIIKLFGRNLRH
jgi:hypothetical protein